MSHGPGPESSTKPGTPSEASVLPSLRESESKPRASTSRGRRQTSCTNSEGFFSFVFDPERLGKWAQARIHGCDGWTNFEAIGLEKDGELVAVTIYDHYTGPNICMSFAAVQGKRWLTRDYLRAIFRYPFLQLGVRRVTGYVAYSNAESLRFAKHLGAKVEGVMRDALPNDHIVILGITRDECRWV